MSEKILNILNLGTCSYGKAWDIQKKLHEQRVAGEIPDTLILVEHPHVYTLGKHADKHNLIATKKYLEQRGIEVYEVDRGGDITYHGPGQLVGYPIFSLKNHDMMVRKFVETIETALINLLADFDIKAGLIDGLTGVWVGNQKIGAIGIRVSKYVAMHGFALNIETDLQLFSGIIPCGITDKGVTRMKNLNPSVTFDNVVKSAEKHFFELFKFDKFRHIESEDYQE